MPPDGGIGIAALQLPSGDPVVWTGHTDVWDHVECAMALSVAGLTESARAAGLVPPRTARRRLVADPVPPRCDRDHNSDSNFCAYIATGVWHHVLVTGDRRFGERMWPTVRAAIDFVLDLQATTGEIWPQGPSGACPRRC